MDELDDKTQAKILIGALVKARDVTLGSAISTGRHSGMPESAIMLACQSIHAAEIAGIMLDLAPNATTPEERRTWLNKYLMGIKPLHTEMIRT